MKPEARKVVWIEWHDAVGDSTRTHFDSLSDCQLCKNTNLGWIIHENDKRIVLAHGFSTSGEVDHFTIPQADIISITPVAPPRARKPKNADQ